MLRFIPGLTGTTYEERLVEVGLDSLADRRLRQDMITTYRIITGTDRMDANDMFNFYGLDARPTRASAYQWNIVEPRARTELRRHFFTNRVATPWNNLPIEVKNAPSINTFRARYDKHRNMQESSDE